MTHQAPIRISVSGTFSSGKTSLVEAAANALGASCTVVAEAARDIMTAMQAVDWAFEPIRRYLLVEQVIREKLATRDDSLVVLCDAGVDSNLAHDRLFGVPSATEVLAHLRHDPYDLVVLCYAGDVAIVDDGKRLTDPDLRSRLDDHIRSVVAELGWPVVQVRGPLDARVAQLLKIIDTLLAGRPIDYTAMQE